MADLFIVAVCHAVDMLVSFGMTFQEGIAGAAVVVDGSVAATEHVDRDSTEAEPSRPLQTMAELQYALPL